MRNVTNVLTVFVLICLAATEGYGNGVPTAIGSASPVGYGSRSVLLDPTDGSFEEVILWYGRGMITYPWPSYQYSYANRFDLSDYGLSAPAYLEMLELAVCKYPGATLNDDVDLFVIGENGGSPDDDDVWYHKVVYDGDWGSIPTWPEWEWVEVDVSPPVLLSENVFYCGVHPYWADGQIDFHVPLDESDNPGVGWIFSGSMWNATANWGFPGNLGVRVAVYTSDDEPPYITNEYPLDEDFPCGVPPDTLVGCHMCDDESGIDIANCEFGLYDSESNPVDGSLDVDDTDLSDVIFMLDPDGDLTEGETYTVDIFAMDLAGNSTSESWDFTVGYVKIDGTSFGRIKAGFTE